MLYVPLKCVHWVPHCAAGAIYANESSEVTILDSVFRNNVGGQGGAVTVWNSSVLVNGTTFSGNIGDGQGVHLQMTGQKTPWLRHLACSQMLAGWLPHGLMLHMAHATHWLGRCQHVGGMTGVNATSCILRHGRIGCILRHGSPGCLSLLTLIKHSRHAWMDSSQLKAPKHAAVIQARFPCASLHSLTTGFLHCRGRLGGLQRLHLCSPR